MQYKEMKTVHLLLKPLENGWAVMHKKLKTQYGTIHCIESKEGITLQSVFQENPAERTEAVEAAVRCVFETTDTMRILVDDTPYTRESWQAARDAQYQKLHKTREDFANVLGKAVHCVMDRPLGSAHPRYPEMIYPVNYGYVPGIMAGDHSEQDVYVLGPKTPLKTFDGVVIAVIHRFDDCEDKWVVAEKTGLYTEAEIRSILNFQEKYYTSEVIL